MVQAVLDALAAPEGAGDLRTRPERYHDALAEAIWRVRVTGDRAQLVQTGATGYAISPDGRAVASVVSADHGDVLKLVARNLVTGRQNMIIMATKPDPGANRWPPNISSLTRAPDDVHLAVQLSVTAAINSVLVFDAFTAATVDDGRTAPAPCTVSGWCGEFDPAYLASGALTYLIQRLSGSGAARAPLRLVFAAGGLVAEGEDGRLDAVLQGEFGEDAADVGLDGLLADGQVPGDLPVAVAAGDQPEHVALRSAGPIAPTPCVAPGPVHLHGTSARPPGVSLQGGTRATSGA